MLEAMFSYLLHRGFKESEHQFIAMECRPSKSFSVQATMTSCHMNLEPAIFVSIEGRTENSKFSMHSMEVFSLVFAHEYLDCACD